MAALLFLFGTVHGARAGVLTLNFTAVIGPGNDIDTANVFGEGAGADLAGQTLFGSVRIDTNGLEPVCGAGCYGDFGAGSVTVGFTVNGVTSTTVSTGKMGYFGSRSGGSVSISDPADGGDNYLAVGAASADGMVQQSLGVLFNEATLFSAHGGDAAVPGAAAAIDSLRAIGPGTGLVSGGVTFLSPIEHLDATLTGISVPEPPGLAVLALALPWLPGARRRKARPIAANDRPVRLHPRVPGCSPRRCLLIPDAGHDR